jgi:hypothetical protein
MNLLYIRAAIQQATGIILTQEEILRLLVEEGLVTRERASDPDLIFRGYEEFFQTDEAVKRIEPVSHLVRDVPHAEQDDEEG